MLKNKLAILCFSGSLFMGLAHAQEGDFSPYVDDQGNISRPTDFKTNPNWIHLGTWGVVNENGEGNGIHNVYTTRDAAAHYRETGSFPDGATLVKEVRGAEAADLTTGRAHWATDLAVWFVSVKDTKGRFTDNPLWGDGWGWALFEAGAPAKQVATDYKADCLGCHVPVKDNDWLYTYAYTAVLGEQAAVSAPQKEAALVTPAPETMTASNVSESDVETVQETVSEPSGAVVADVQEETAASVDLVAAENAFRTTCKVCHSAEQGKNGIGPSLAGIVGRKAGSVEGFNYSTAMKESGVVWSDETLDAHLLNSKTFIPGNRMGPLFPSGVQDEEKRKLIIAYLNTLSSE